MTSTHVFADNVRESSASTGTGSFVTTGGSVAVPTPTLGRTIASVCAVGDTFDYAIHHTTADEWEIGLGEYSTTNTFTRERVYASSNGGNLVSFSSGEKQVFIGPVASFRDHFADIYNIKTYGATDGGSNAADIVLARTAAGVNRPVMAPYGDNVWGIKSSTLADFTRDTKGEGSLWSFSQGTNSAPSTRSNPLIYLEKYTNGDAVSNDHGLLDFRLKKVGGTTDIYTYGAYIAAENAGGIGGRVSPLAVLFKGSNASAVNDVGMVVYVEKSVATPGGMLTGIEVDVVDTSGDDNGWADTFTFDSTMGINVVNALGRSTVGLRVGTATLGNGFYTGILIDVDSILPNSYDGNAEAIRIKGGSTSSTRYDGIWMQSGYLKQGINLVGPNYNSGVMMLLPKDNYITFGTADSGAERIRWNNSLDSFEVEGGSIAIAGTKVLGAQITGWATPTGTATRTGFVTSSVDVASLAEHVKALIDDLKTHGVLGT
jgi:hypothetical protein